MFLFCGRVKTALILVFLYKHSLKFIFYVAEKSVKNLQILISPWKVESENAFVWFICLHTVKDESRSNCCQDPTSKIKLISNLVRWFICQGVHDSKSTSLLPALV